MSGDIPEEEWKDEALRNPKVDSKQEGRERKRRNALTRVGSGKESKPRDIDPRLQEVVKNLGYVAERIPLPMRIALAVMVTLIVAMLLWVGTHS